MTDLDLSALDRFLPFAKRKLEERKKLDGWVRSLALVVEIDCGDMTDIDVVSLDDRPWVQLAFLDRALGVLEERDDARRDLLREADGGEGG